MKLDKVNVIKLAPLVLGLIVTVYVCKEYTVPKELARRLKEMIELLR